MIGAIVRSYYLTKYLKAVLKSLAHLDKIIVANYRFINAEKKEDNTEEVIKDYFSIPRPSNITLIKGEGKEQHDIFNDCLEKLKDCDYVFINDADEFILRKDRDEMVEQMMSRKLSAGFCDIIDYASLTERYPSRPHRPVMIVKPDVKFYAVRNLHYGNGVFFDKYVHHFGYVGELDWKKSWYGAPKELERIPTQRKHDCKIPEEIMGLLEDL